MHSKYKTCIKLQFINNKQTQLSKRLYNVFFVIISDPPAGYQVKFSANKRFLRVNLSISQVYPVPNCSLYLEVRKYCKFVCIISVLTGLFYAFTKNKLNIKSNINKIK